MKGANNDDLRACALGIPRREGQTVAFLLGGVMLNRFSFFFFSFLLEASGTRRESR